MSQLRTRLEPVTPFGVVIGMAVGWAAIFGWLATVRHLAGGSHAEDLGFTDQILSNFVRGQWFRMSIYQGDAGSGAGSTWNTELDLSRLARPDSLLAFHVEPMLLLFVPLYALGGGAVALLIIQALGMAAGAIPAYSLGRHLSRSVSGGLVVAAAYLLSPLGQWAVLSDFHTSTLAAPLLLLSVERLVVAGSAPQALLAAGLAASAREDVGPVLAVVGCVALLRLAVYRRRAAAGREQAEPVATVSAWGPAGLVVLGVGWTIFSALVIRRYSGDLSPFEVRYAATLGAGPGPSLSALIRPDVIGYVRTLLLGGGWLGLLAPLALLPALPALALNALSTSPWMAAGKAHYSGLVLPFVIVGTAAGLGRLRIRPRARAVASGALLVTSLLGYTLEGAGPLGANYAPAALTDHAARAESIAASLPDDAGVSASSTLVPRISHRSRVYVFPAVLDADYIFLDLLASPAPTSAGDVYLRVNGLLARGDWHLQTADDGLVLLQRGASASSAQAGRLFASGLAGDAGQPPETTADNGVSLISAELAPSPDGGLDVAGPLWILRTRWRASRPLARGTRLQFDIKLRDGQQLHVWDVACLWWNPPEDWTPGEAVTVDVPDIPVRQFQSWQAIWSTDT